MGKEEEEEESGANVVEEGNSIIAGANATTDAQVKHTVLLTIIH